MDNYFQYIFSKISGSQEDNQRSIFGCHHSFFGRRGHEDTQILLPWMNFSISRIPYSLFFLGAGDDEAVPEGGEHREDGPGVRLGHDPG